MLKIIKTLDDWLDKFCIGALIISLFLILIFSFSPIILRPLHINFEWFDPLVRHLVFLCCFLGGALATGRGTNISIDILARYFQAKENHKAEKWLGFFVSIASFATVCWFITTGIDFTEMEMEFGKVEFLGIKSGYLVTIIPFGFALIAFRFLVLAIQNAADLLGHKGV